jgi:hypothetical protein
MKLISEQTEKIENLTETTDSGKKAHYIIGPFIQTEVTNRNGRFYQRPMMEGVISKYNEDKVSKNSAYGELNHPEKPTINLDRVCILVKELTWDKNDVIGKARITETPMGNIVKGIMESGGQLGVSTRGLGELEKLEDGRMLVKPGYVLAAAADVVSDPSAPSCYVKGIMEGVEYFYDENINGWRTTEIVETHKNIIHKKYKQIDEEKALFLFTEFVKSVGK